MGRHKDEFEKTRAENRQTAPRGKYKTFPEKPDRFHKLKPYRGEEKNIVRGETKNKGTPF